jgi:hypothetical protein
VTTWSRAKLLASTEIRVARAVLLKKHVHPTCLHLGDQKSSLDAGSAPFTLTVNGSKFVNGDTVDWNGVPLATTFVSASKLTAKVSAA